jgi:dipicolinate synthase subunit A
MKDYLFFAAGRSPATTYAIDCLQEAGYVFTQTPCSAVTHLLLPVPSLDADGRIKGGQSLNDLLAILPKGITIIGGNLPPLENYRVIDLLKDPLYVAENASITAYCAIRHAMNKLPITLKGCPCLIIGWGRIGKCLARLLKAMDAQVTVFARKETDRAMLAALGYDATDSLSPENYRLIFNTAPELLLPDCPGDALKIDLASVPGITGQDVLWARGLPGKDAPESAGSLMARRILYYI